MIASGIIQSNLSPVGNFHLIPKDKVSKFELVNLIKGEIGRDDIKVNEFKAGVIIDRTLSSEFADLNARIWSAAGFITPPTISEMVKLGL
jgi:hypothetical protein